jgi:hypothetical protein
MQGAGGAGNKLAASSAPSHNRLIPNPAVLIPRVAITAPWQVKLELIHT